MKSGSVLLGAAIATALSLSSASATVRIVSDHGGQIGPYLEQLAALRHSGERVVIDGPCLSACTMILGVIPRDRICVTARPARFPRRLEPWRPWVADRPRRRHAASDGDLSAAGAAMDQSAGRSEAAHGLSQRPRAHVDVSHLPVALIFPSVWQPAHRARPPRPEPPSRRRRHFRNAHTARPQEPWRLPSSRREQPRNSPVR